MELLWHDFNLIS